MQVQGRVQSCRQAGGGGELHCRAERLASPAGSSGLCRSAACCNAAGPASPAAGRWLLSWIVDALSRCPLASCPLQFKRIDPKVRCLWAGAIAGDSSSTAGGAALMVVEATEPAAAAAAVSNSSRLHMQQRAVANGSSPLLQQLPAPRPHSPPCCPCSHTRSSVQMKMKNVALGVGGRGRAVADRANRQVGRM